MLLGCSISDESSLSENEAEQVALWLEQVNHLKEVQADSSLALAQRVFDLSREKGYDPGVAASALIIAEICYEKGEYQKANTYLVESTQLFEQLGNAAALGKSYNLRGSIFQNNGRFGQARDHFTQALAQFESIGDRTGIAETYGNLGHFHEKRGVYDSAIHYNLLARDMYREVRDSTGLAIIYDNIGSIYEDQEDFEQARANFQVAYQINTQLGHPSEALTNRNNVADTYRKTEQYEEALSMYQQVIRGAKQYDQAYELLSAYRDVARTYFPLGQLQEAYRYLDSCYVLADELANQERVRGIEDTRSVYEIDKKQRQIELLEKNHQLNRIVRTALIGLAALLIVIGLLVYLQMKTRIKKDQLLFEAEKQLTQAKQEQLEAEINLKQLREEKMHQELEDMSKELTTSALNIIRKNKFLSQLKDELKNMKSSRDEALNKEIKKAIKSINYNFNIDEDWHEFEAVFQQVHEQFFEDLRKSFPDLTASEVRLCAMIRLNLNSKDMATIIGISQDSLRIARYRLRKKLGVEKGANLYSFVMTFG